MINVSEDGYIRLSLGIVQRTPLTHLISGLDEEWGTGGVLAARACDISGYTEWVSRTAPVISLGWDWQLDVTFSGLLYVRTGAPRTNLMLLDADNRDLGEAASQQLIGGVIDAIDWQSETRKAITERYV